MSLHREVHVNAPSPGRALWGFVIGALVVPVFLVTPPAGAADAQAAGASGVKRTAKQVAEDIQAAGQELAPLFNSPQDLFDARRREAAAPKAIPALRRMVKLLEEFQMMRPVGTAEGQER